MPNGFAVELPNPEPVAEAKLLNFPPVLPPNPPPLPKPPPNPEPKAANPEAPVFPNGEALLVALNPLPADFSSDVAVGLLKTEGVVAGFPNVPKGDCSCPAKEARPDAANAEEDVVFVFGASASDDLGPSDANGETLDVFRKALGRDD